MDSQSNQFQKAIKGLKVAIVADWLASPGGAEKVVESIAKLFPEAPIYTTIYNPDKITQFKNRVVKTTWLQKLPYAKTKHQLYIVLMPKAIRSLDLSGYDLVISSSHTVGHGIRVGPNTIHICYCHTPVRWAWVPEIDDLAKRIKIGFLSRFLMNYFKRWDLANIDSVDTFIANSKYIRERIKQIYHRDSVVIYPPVNTDYFQPSGPISKDLYFLCAGRLIPYKKNDVIIKAFNQLGLPLKVVGTGPEMDNLKAIAKSNIEFTGFVSDQQLKDYYRHAQAFIFAALEDFGIVPVEAMSAGTPVIAFGQGGATETVIPKLSGVLFDKQSPESLIKAVKQFQKMHFDSTKLISWSESFSETRFLDEMRQLIVDCLNK